jgi:predicted TIM-barrel fold metal-dependent hydrolase
MWLVRKVETTRILFGSDHPANVPVELVKYRSLNLGAVDLANILGKNAQRVFQLKS